MKPKENVKTIWTIGHSVKTQEEFLATLASFNIEVLADVRRYTGSKKYPQFKASALGQYLPVNGITYLPKTDLGGRRKPNLNTKNTIWRNESFRGYADYAETEEFKIALAELMEVALNRHTAYMCSEVLWWRCHRAIISDYLKVAGWKVMHIMKENSATEHPYTAAFRATISNIDSDI